MQSAALVLGITREAESAFDQIVRRYEAQLLRIAWRMLGNRADAEEVAQDVLVRLYRHGTDFPSEAGLSAWLYRVTVNRCIDRSRSRVDTAELVDIPEMSSSAETLLIREEQKERLSRALLRLPARERAAVVLREIEDVPTAEVAAILGSSEATVRSQVSKAISKLRMLLTKEIL